MVFHFSPDLRFGPKSSLPRVAEQYHVTRHEPPLPFGRRHMGCPRGARETDGPSSEGLLSATIRPRDTPAKSAPFLSPSGSGLLDHVGCHASRSMRRRICRKRVLVKWLSASCRMKYRACRMGLAVVPGPRISQVLLDQRAQTEALVQLAREQQPHIGGDGSAAELDAKLRIEREANRIRCRVTHGVVPSASARSRREPRFLRVLSDYGLVR